MAVKSLFGSDNKKTTSSQSFSDEVVAKARKDYYDTLAYLRSKGIKVDVELAGKVKHDLLEHHQIMNFV